MFKTLILGLSLFFIACASTEESPLRDNGRAASIRPSAPASALDHTAQDIRQSAKFARLSKTIRFENGGATLTPDTRRALNEIVNEMKLAASSFERVRISGFSDAQGNLNRNHEVSQQRAEAVRSYLVSRGVEASKLEAVAMGSLYANQNKKLSRSELIEDRRVELEIVE